VTIAWRREDSGYLAAAAAAAVVVAYIVFGNFGLVPSPFSAPDVSPAVIDAIQPVGVQAAPIDVQRVAAPDPTITNEPPADVPADQPPVDGAKPAVAFTTEAGSSVSVIAPAVVEGIVQDADSGIDKVLVTFAVQDGTSQVVPAEISCDDAKNRKCVWQAKVPAAVASDYVVTAEAIDRAGNTAVTKAIDYSVVNAGGTVSQVTDVVGRAPTVLGKLVGDLLGGG
jgi:hypothetical protein